MPFKNLFSRKKKKKSNDTSSQNLNNQKQNIHPYQNLNNQKQNIPSQPMQTMYHPMQTPSSNLITPNNNLPPPPTYEEALLMEVVPLDKINYPDLHNPHFLMTPMQIHHPMINQAKMMSTPIIQPTSIKPQYNNNRNNNTSNNTSINGLAKESNLIPAYPPIHVQDKEKPHQW